MTPGILLDWIKTFPKFGTDQGLRPISVKLRNGGLTTRGDQRGDNLIFLVTFDALFTSYIILSSSWLIVCAGLFFLLFSPEKVSGLSNQGRARLSINIFLLRCLKMGDRLNWTSVWDGRMFRVYMRGRHDYGGDAAKEKKKKGGLQAQQEGGGARWAVPPKTGLSTLKIWSSCSGWMLQRIYFTPQTARLFAIFCILGGQRKMYDKEI